MEEPKTLASGVVSVFDDTEGKIVEMATEKAAKDEGLGGVCEAEELADIGKDCPVNEAEIHLIGVILKEENGAESGFSEPQLVETEDVVKETNAENSPSKGISLYVDISGSPSGFVKDKNGEEKRDRGIDGQEFSFVVGDVVWVQAKNQSWWPGKVSDPVDAPKSATKSGDGDDLLVWNYGINLFAWCFPNQVKPFWKDFEEMSGKNKARVFRSAVEKAVDEFGERVKSEMTCSCNLKGKSVHKSVTLGGFSVTSFESVPFLERLKYAARFVSVPRALDLTVARNRLSAFYSSIGHKQLPMNLLEKEHIEEEDTLPGPEKIEDHVEDEKTEDHVEDEKISEHVEGLVSSGSRKRKTRIPAKFKTDYYYNEVKERFRGKDEVSDMGFESRERKKSRFLSYPYVNVDPKVKESLGFSQDIMSPSSCKSNGEKFWKKWYKGFSGGIQNPSGSDLADANTTVLLHELLSIAVNGLESNEDNSFNSIGWFISRFRISAYHDESVDELFLKDITGPNEVDEVEACLSGITAPESKSKRKRPKKNEDAVKDSPAGKKDKNETINSSSGKNLLTPVKRRRKSDSGKLKTKALSGLSDVKITVAALGESVKDALKSRRKKKVKGKGSSVDCPQTEQTANIPDLNGSNDTHVVKEDKSDILTVPEPEANAVSISPGLLVPCVTKPGNLVVDLRVPLENVMLGKKPTPKKRKRNEKSVTASDNIPDLNGVNSEPNLLGKESRETNGVDLPKKPEKKKRKKKNMEIVFYPRNPSHLATTLALTFCPGTEMPKKEDLISRFGAFGELRDSETKVSEDSGAVEIAFVKSADASKAFKSVEKVNPFGSTLINFRLLEPRAPVTTEAPAQPPSLDFIRQNLQRMTTMLEKSGENLSGEMRTKLEAEIKGLLGKVSSMTGSSS